MSMNKHPNSNGSRSIVPIFANKKRRLKQALYATPSTTTSINDQNDENTSSYFNFKEPARQGSFTRGNDITFQSESSIGEPRPSDSASLALGSSDKRGSFGPNRRPPSVNQIISYGHGTGNNASFGAVRGENANGFGRGQAKQGFGGNKTAKGFKQPRNPATKVLLTTLPPPSVNRIKPLQTEQDSGSLRSLKNYPATNTSYKHNTSTYVPLPGTSQQGYSPEKSSTKHRVQGRPKQVNLMKEPPDKTLKFLTSTIKNILQWGEYRDQLSAIFEVFGTLDSAFSSNAAGNAKNFVLKDSTGTMRCTFWEMDRILPRLTRGQTHRCVGCLERRSAVLNCVSIRPARPAEQRGVTSSLATSEKAVQEYLAAFREY